jgi:ATPases of the AAA+ class
LPLVASCHAAANGKQQTANRSFEFDTFSLKKIATQNMNTTEKTLRLMLKRGIPMDAVKQRAKMAGIDMTVVLQQQHQQHDEDEQEQQEQDLGGRDEEINRYQGMMIKGSPCSLSPTLISKYKRMLKCGVPLAAVQQVAFVEGGWSPEQTVQIFESAVVIERRSRRHHVSYKSMASMSCSMKRARCKARKLVKYHRMMKVGVPLSAVEQCIMLDQSRCSRMVCNGLDDEDREYDENLKSILKEIHQVQYVKRTKHFSVTDDGIKLCSSSKSSLAALVQKMVQTVHSSHSKITSSTFKEEDKEMNVDNEILFRALGALQGVQVALDDFNSAANHGNEKACYSDAEIKIRRQAFVEIAKNISIKLPTTLKNYASIPGLDELISHICSRYKEKIARMKEQFKRGSYDFESLAYLYLPGSKVVAKNVGGSSDGGGAVDMMCLVGWNRYEMGMLSTGKAAKVFKVCFKYIVALSPSEATMVEVVEEMPCFQGYRQMIDHLTFVPLEAYSTTEQYYLLTKFENRGRTYNSVALSGSFTHMDYQKGSFFLKQQSMLGLGKVNSFAAGLASGGRIIVDTQGAYEHGHTLSFGYDPMVMGIKYKFKEYQLYARSVDRPNNAKSTNAAQNGLIIFDEIPDSYLPIVWPYVVGFSLTMKAWGDVLVDGMTCIQWKRGMFDSLVLPECHKRMIKALVRNKPTSFQDLVEGKGQSTVFLMYGSPGVGKTLTAEALAEELQRPLYSISMGSMGTTARELEGNLTFVMNMSAKWDALVLLDEADSFLETRSSHSSLERNAMVCVMLRLVEYFSGVLFLTSNHIDAIDPAFLTRISLALHYDSLDENARKRVWMNLLIKSGYENLIQNGTIFVGRLAKFPLNGREIKNALRLAISISAEDGVNLCQNSLVEMIEIVNDCKQSIQNPYDSSRHSRKLRRRGAAKVSSCGKNHFNDNPVYSRNTVLYCRY